MTAPYSKVRPGREVDKERRAIINRLINQGWSYLPGPHFKLVPPDPHLPIVVSSTTPSDIKGDLNWLSDLRRSGARLDEPAPRRRPTSPGEQAPLEAVESDLQPVLTHGAWWRPQDDPEPAPEPVPEPVAVPVQRQRRVPPPAPVNPLLDPDAKGESWTLAQARTMLRQGYHVNKVIQRTGWGRNWLADLVDGSGFLAEAAALPPVAL